MKYRSYQEMKDAHQKEVNDFPMHFAFTNERLDEELAKMGCGIEDIISIGGGGFIHKNDKEAFIALFEKIRSEEREFRKTKKNLIATFVSELQNHEFGYTGDISETLESCGYDIVDFLNDTFAVECMKAALKKLGVKNGKMFITALEN